MDFRLRREEKLKSKKLIEALYSNGNSILVYPFRMVYLPIDHKANQVVQCGFGVSKKKFKRAVDRNRIKRLMREVYRQQKHIIYKDLDKKHIIMINYIDEKLPNYVQIEEKLILLLIKFMEKVKD
ncbi:ribonuclease P protein component [Flavobacteriaceae bacterium F08102]|nr:ribonuclease P protein component [Flavobacteriaceae bacterium F08102]